MDKPADVDSGFPWLRTLHLPLELKTVMANIFVKHDTGAVIVLQLITLPELNVTLGSFNSADHVNKVISVLQQSYDNYQALKDDFPADEQFSVWE